ncbi:hypothetical protein WK43_26940 [Burkholderia ubonensis]|nr:hypothetical protein WK37_26910 [Burkholderia ubonensis]KVS42832.1 hypothetical protein WK38_26390 [Burkholderia ubonensis]KVS67872.1 hypothetical protein WK42_31430 [Burkholderia ubonensis]KVS81384.1 hypothetical protein WK43_26940 [Burkholderia ubonensis]KVS86604.1 hypothetical protein WK44_19115 [Burkholderia ubonensis]
MTMMRLSKPIKRRSCLGIRTAFEAAVAIAQHLDPDRAAIGDDRLAVGVVAFIGLAGRLVLVRLMAVAGGAGNLLDEKDSGLFDLLKQVPANSIWRFYLFDFIKLIIVRQKKFNEYFLVLVLCN